MNSPSYINLETARAAALRELGVFVSLSESLGDQDWSRPTPCAGWNVGDLVGHVAGIPGYGYFAGRLRAARVGGAGPGTNSSPIVPGAPSEVTGPLRRGAAEFAAEMERLSDGDLDRSLPILPGRSQLLRAALGQFVWEFALHRYDLEWALGNKVTLAPDVIRAVVLMTETNGRSTTRIDGYVPRAATPAPEVAESYVLVGDTVRWAFSFTPGVPSRPTSPTRSGNWSAGAVHERSCTIRGSDSAVCLVLCGRISTHNELVSATRGFVPRVFTVW
jgi:uncharacterized protein (TIGR03083 family)